MKYQILFIAAFLLQCQTNTQQRIIAIQPFEDINQVYLDSLKEGLSHSYKSKVVFLDHIQLPPSTFIKVKTPRYRADKLIAYLKKTKPDSVDYIIGVTQKDISTTKRSKNGQIKKPVQRYTDWGIFGLGYRPGPSCILSTYRLKGKGNKTLIKRIQKVGIHEIGHNLGLKHCPNKTCVMQDAAESIKTIDGVKGSLCKDCKGAI